MQCHLSTPVLLEGYQTHIPIKNDRTIMCSSDVGEAELKMPQIKLHWCKNRVPPKNPKPVMHAKRHNPENGVRKKCATYVTLGSTVLKYLK